MTNAYRPWDNPNEETGDQTAYDLEDVGTQTGAGSGSTLRLYRQRVTIGGTTRVAVAAVTNAAPSSTDYGLVVRTVGSTTTSYTYAEDSAHTSGDNGAFVLGVRNDTLSTTLTSASGDYSPMATDSRGAVWIIPGTAAADLGKAEDAAHTSGDVGVMSLGVRNDAAGTALAGADGDYTPLAVTAQGEQFIVGHRAEDAVHTSGDRGLFALHVRNDNLSTTLTSATGDYSGMAVDSRGAAWIIPGTGASDLGKAEDAAHASGDVGVFTLGVRNDAPVQTARTSANNDYGPLSTDQYGNVQVVGAGLEVTGTASALNESAIVSTDVSNFRWVSIQTTGTWVGTLTFQCSNDNVNFVSCPLISAAAISGSGTVATATNAIFYGPIRTRYFRAIFTAYTSGTVTATAEFSVMGAALITALHQAAGDAAHDALDGGGNPVKIGYHARTTNPSAVANADRANAISDDIGRQVIVTNQVRDLKTDTYTALTGNTETTIVAAGGAGVFHDLTHLVVSNTGTAAISVTIRKSTGGATAMLLRVPSNQTVPIPFSDTFLQDTANNNWTAQSSSGTGDANITAQYVKNI